MVEVVCEMLAEEIVADVRSGAASEDAVALLLRDFHYAVEDDRVDDWFNERLGV